MIFSFSAVVSMPDDKWGERPAAFIVLEKGRTLNEEQIISHCRAHLAGYKVNRIRKKTLMC
jgi:fatty-acyl-CoA synthase